MATFTSVPAAPATAPSETMMVDLSHAALAQSITMGAFDQDFNFDEAYLSVARSCLLSLDRSVKTRSSGIAFSSAS